MKLTSPLTPEQIREGMAEVIEKIQEETKWDLVRTFSDVSISFGEATEYGPDFGITRTKDSIIFGNWLTTITPEITWLNIWEFIIIREAFGFFFDDKLYFSSFKEIIDYYLNLLAISYLRMKYDRRAMEIKFTNIRARFLFINPDFSNEDRELNNILNELCSIIITQTISYRLIRNTLLDYLEDLPFDELDRDDLINYTYRYLCNSPEEIISPVRVEPKTLQIIEKLVEFGFSGTTKEIADSLNINQTTFSRLLNQIAVRYKAKYRVEKNFYKLGLHHHLIIVTLDERSEQEISQIFTLLEKIKYIHEIYEGFSDDNSRIIYCITLCPLIVAERLNFRLEKLEKSHIIRNFEIKPIRNRIFKTTMINKKFVPTIDNFRLLIKNEISCSKIITWENSNFAKELMTKFEKRDKKMLRFMNIYQSNGIVNYGDYKVFQAELIKFLKDNNYNPNRTQECLDFMNSVRKTLLDNNLIDFRLQLTISSLIISNLFVIKIDCDPDNEDILKLIEKMSVFSWMVIHFGYEEIFFSVFGLEHNHEVAKMLINEIEKSGYKCNCFSVTSKVWRYVPLDELYSYPDKKWFLS